MLQVRNFHKKFYRPENLTIILAGQIQADDVFRVLGTVEDDIIAKVTCMHYITVSIPLHLVFIFKLLYLLLYYLRQPFQFLNWIIGLSPLYFVVGYYLKLKIFLEIRYNHKKIEHYTASYHQAGKLIRLFSTMV